MLPRKMVSEKIMRQFLARINPAGDNGCWLWKGSVNGSGYGTIGYFSKQILAHRLSYMIFRAKITEEIVCHKCDNPLCVNPKHLFIGTARDNLEDSRHKLRSTGMPLSKSYLKKHRYWLAAL